MEFFYKRSSYLFITLLIFCIEVLIALYVRDDFIRPYGGDILAVILLYFMGLFVFPKCNAKKLAIWVLCFAFVLELGQAIGLVETLGLADYKWARIIIGTSFSYGDLICYFIGFCFCWLHALYSKK